MIRSGLSRLAVLASRLRVGPVAVACALAISVFVVLGILQRTTHPTWDLANMDSEVSAATWFSAALLWAAAFWWLLVAAVSRPISVAVWTWSALLAWLAFDEGTAVHERVERWTGIDWQIIYVPVMMLGAAAWWGVVRRYRSDLRVVGLLVAAAGAWSVALVLELVQNWGGSPVRASIYNPTMIAEEALEMIGSSLLFIAAILALRRSIPSASEGTEETVPCAGES